MSKILVAHSPDADDIFMYYALYFGWINNKNIKFENIALDIESLNKGALQSKYLVSAISFGMYPFIKNNYALLNTAMSFGNGYGPKLIKKKGKVLKNNFKVALSGELTTNAMIFKIKYKNVRIVYKNFLEIESAVLSDEVDAGVLIHESILNFDESLEVEANLWDIWLELAKDELPLPLGGMAISRSIPILRAIEIQRLLGKAVEVAVNNKKILSKMLKNLVRVNEEELETYLNMYANKDSINLSLLQIKALDKLFEIGFNAKIYKDLINIRDFLIPIEYESLRFS
ncbi:menaquinone biosynthesis family protein [Helicobacter sp. MIT 14-3879]|uniref:menaquinone biosynthesis family protein n=1 Tax=Helicobacter sp. MIT 14-3879 TaxID=2040649 RepID=UPI000E1E3368|nr:MqnA/MqnD/SBP family protein [Helicobacter sp. MIT 14-3879]RDU65526.1 S-ribosylhomocysteine lyase [Helicobacter sp. MIT 14-3879]